MSNELEQLEFKLEKNIGIYEHAGKVRKILCVNSKQTTESNEAFKNLVL